MVKELLARFRAKVRKAREGEGTQQVPDLIYRSGERIGDRYEIVKVLGEGSLGVVHLARLGPTQHCALKTFRDELCRSDAARETFKAELSPWVKVGPHACIVTANCVTTLGSRPVIEMEHVPADDEGRTSLADRLSSRSGRIDIGQATRWALHLCHGMHHALNRGLKFHGDIKPANLLISRDKVLRVADLGLAAAFEAALRADGDYTPPGAAQRHKGLPGMTVIRVAGKPVCGTPGYMPPEVYWGERADVRSDVYSCGLVLWQMVTGSIAPPFTPGHASSTREFLEETYKRQVKGATRALGTRLDHVIEKCLRPDPQHRYAGFEELAADLDGVLAKIIGVRTWYRPGADIAEAVPVKAASAKSLAQFEATLQSCKQVVESDPQSAIGWANVAAALADLGRHSEALVSYARALDCDSSIASIWSARGSLLARSGKHPEALECYDKALAIDSQDASTWSSKGLLMARMGRQSEALMLFEKALSLNAECSETWAYKGCALAELQRKAEALFCWQKALAANPRDARTLFNMGVTLADLGRREDALRSYKRAVEVEPSFKDAWCNKAIIENALGMGGAASRSYSRYVALCNKGAE
ncbi:MAG TPA: serine/threonine-protein kinase [Planctomycetota bacterium]